jgi:hypothetical protein
VVLGFLFEKTGRSILGFFRTAKPMTASQGHIQNEQQGDFLRFPMISRAAEWFRLSTSKATTQLAGSGDKAGIS